MSKDCYVMELFVHNPREALPIVNERMRASDIPYYVLENDWHGTRKDPIAYCKLLFNSLKDATAFRNEVGTFHYTGWMLKNGERTYAYHLESTDLPPSRYEKYKKPKRPKGYSGPSGTVLGRGRALPGL